MEIRTQQETVRYFMWALETIRLDMCGLEYGQRVLLSDRATSPVRISDSDSERALSEARPDEMGDSVASVALAELEDERGKLIGLKRPAGSWFPKVDLFDGGRREKALVPTVVRYRNRALHRNACAVAVESG